MLDRDADGVGDDGGRQRAGEGVEDLDAAAGGEPLDQPDGDGADARLPRRRRPRREPPADDAAVAGVERWVDVLQLVLDVGHVAVQELAHTARGRRLRGCRRRAARSQSAAGTGPRSSPFGP